MPPCRRSTATSLLWTLLGALTQIGGTALMLMTMEQRSFVVTIAYLKTEPVLVALMGLAFLHDPLTPADGAGDRGRHGGRGADLRQAGSAQPAVRRPALLGLPSAALFAASAIGYRGAILSLHATGFVLASTVSLAAGLTPADRSADGLAAAVQPRDSHGAARWNGGPACWPVSPARPHRNSGSWPLRWPPPPACAPWRWWRCCSRKA